MSDTLLSICQAVSSELLYDAPQTIIGNQDANAILLKAFASSTCKELIRDHQWQALKRTYTFTTSVGVDAYDLPSDIRAPLNLTFWNRSEKTPVQASSSIEWQALQSGVLLSGIRYNMVFEQNQLKIYPVPSYEMTIAFNYYSNAFAEDGTTGTAKSDFTLDTDVCRLDGDLIVRGVKVKLAQRFGLPWGTFQADYDSAIEQLQDIDEPRGIIDLSGSLRKYSNAGQYWPNLV
jgi:hypothetical protein